MTLFKKLRKKIDDASNLDNKKSHGEVSTPYKLRQQMLDLIDDEFWTTPKTVVEPCCGKGGFVIDIIERFSKHMTIKEAINCVTFIDINEDNVNFTSNLLKEYNTNGITGNSLELNIEADIYISNPPYNSPGLIRTGNSIWHHFINHATKMAPLVLFVTPAGWRKPLDNRSKYKTDLNLRYLRIHGIKDGKKMFNCDTRYDYYLHDVNYNGDINVIDEKGGHHFIKQKTFIPHFNINHDFTPFYKYEILHYSSRARSYDTIKVKDDEHPYEIIYSIHRNKIIYLYSSKYGSGMGVSKLIVGSTNLRTITDLEGQYGLSEGAFAFKIKNKDEAVELKLLLKELNPYAYQWCGFRVDWRIFKSP